MAIDAAAIAELGLGPMPDAFYRRLSELFMVTSHWHVFPDAYPALDALQERGLIVGAVSNWVWNLPELLHALDLVSRSSTSSPPARASASRSRTAGSSNGRSSEAGVAPETVIHVGDHVDADVEGAPRVGIGAVLIDRDGRYRGR